MSTEIDKITEMETLIDHGNKEPPESYKKVTAQFVFDVKYDGMKRARLVGGGH